MRPEDVREDKGCNGVPGGDLIVVLLVSATGESWRQREGLNDPGARFSHPQPYHIILPSQNRYENRDELLDLDDLRVISEGKVNLLNKMLRQSLFQQPGLFNETC